MKAQRHQDRRLESRGGSNTSTTAEATIFGLGAALLRATNSSHRRSGFLLVGKKKFVRCKRAGYTEQAEHKNVRDCINQKENGHPLMTALQH